MNEVVARFGVATPKRIELAATLVSWASLAQAIGTSRFLVDGSFVTAKSSPNDIDCACWLPRDFQQQYEWGRPEAVEMYRIIATNHPRELLPFFRADDWENYVKLFAKVRGEPLQWKGMIEVVL